MAKQKPSNPAQTIAKVSATTRAMRSIAKKRWRNVTPEERSAHGRRMIEARWRPAHASVPLLIYREDLALVRSALARALTWVCNGDCGPEDSPYFQATAKDKGEAKVEVERALAQLDKWMP